MKRLLVLSWCVVQSLACSGCITGCDANYSNGARTGVVYKLSRKGVIYKDWEGELLLNQFALQNNTGNAWEFSVQDPEIAKELEQAQSSGEKVTLHYRQWLMGPIGQDTPYTVESVEHTAQ